MRALAARLRRLERALDNKAGRMVVVEAPGGGGPEGRVRAALAAGGVAPAPADVLLVLRRFRDEDGPARLAAVHPVGRR